jgi:hypothetical protein
MRPLTVVEGSQWSIAVVRSLHLIIAITLLLTSAAASGQQIDPALRGVWKLNVAKSDFGPWPKPKMGQVNWTEHGWVFALVTADGRMYADGAMTDRGCTLIGVPGDYSCEVKVVTPRRVHLTLRQGSAVRRVGDIELLDKNTTRTTHRVTPAQGAPYVEKTIWEREAE